MKARLGVLTYEKEVSVQAQSQENISQGNMELFLAQEKEWRASELDKLFAALEEAKVRMWHKGINKAVEYIMRFRRFTLFLIR